MIERKIMGWHVIFVGFKNVKIPDTDILLNRIRKEASDCQIQVFDAEKIAGFDHLYFSVLNALKAAESGFDYVDINMGCAVKAVTQNGAGVSLMGDPEKAARVVRQVVEAVSIPVTCKIRLGASRGELNAVELAEMLEDAGVSAITVHGRSGEKKFGEKLTKSCG